MERIELVADSLPAPLASCPATGRTFPYSKAPAAVCVVLEWLPVVLGARLAYVAPMELQTQIDELKASMRVQRFAIVALSCVIVAGVGIAAVQSAGDAEFDTITCKAWQIVDKDGKVRIAAETDPDGRARVQWLDKDEKQRIAAETDADGNAGVQWLDKDEKRRIAALTSADGTVALPTGDLKK